MKTACSFNSLIKHRSLYFRPYQVKIVLVKTQPQIMGNKVSRHCIFEYFELILPSLPNTMLDFVSLRCKDWSQKQSVLTTLNLGARGIRKSSLEATILLSLIVTKAIIILYKTSTKLMYVPLHAWLTMLYLIVILRQRRVNN